MPPPPGGLPCFPGPLGPALHAEWSTVLGLPVPSEHRLPRAGRRWGAGSCLTLSLPRLPFAREASPLNRCWPFPGLGCTRRVGRGRAAPQTQPRPSAWPLGSTVCKGIGVPGSHGVTHKSHRHPLLSMSQLKGRGSDRAGDWPEVPQLGRGAAGLQGQERCLLPRPRGLAPRSMTSGRAG